MAELSQFSAKIKLLRQSYGLTQEQLAERLWTTKSVISSYETGARQPTYQNLIKLATTFRVSTDWLLGINEDVRVSSTNLTESQIEAVNHIVIELQKANGTL